MTTPTTTTRHTPLHRIAAIMALIMIAMAAPRTAAAANNGTNAFKSGETLTYKLYFNWKFIWLNAGTATMTTTYTRYDGRQAWRCALTTTTSKKIDKYFRMRDTLLCYTTKDIRPLYYRKGAREGDRYYIDEITYSYSASGADILMEQTSSKGVKTQKRQKSRNYAYDMMSIFLRARNFSTDGWKKGYTYLFPIADGKGIETARLRFLGRSTVKGEDGNKYKCLELAYIETEDGKQKEIVRFYVTDDSRHIPIRIDLFLKFGTAKAFVSNMKNV